MNASPFNPAFYTPSNRLALDLYRRDCEALADRLYDEASEAALAGNPKRAQYLEDWARRTA